MRVSYTCVLIQSDVSDFADLELVRPKNWGFSKKIHLHYGFCFKSGGWTVGWKANKRQRQLTWKDNLYCLFFVWVDTITRVQDQIMILMIISTRSYDQERFWPLMTWAKLMSRSLTTVIQSKESVEVRSQATIVCTSVPEWRV